MLVLLLIVAVFIAAVVWIYNRLVRARNLVLSAWSDIDVQLLRRHDLVPQLVNTVKVYAAYEKTTLSAIAELRSRSESARHLADKAVVENEIDEAVHKLIAVAEAYPQLKADGNFLQLQKDLVAIEDYIQYARRFYNGAVRIFNTSIQSFPQLLVAGPAGFKPAEFFEVQDPAQRAAVQVKLQ